MVISQESNVIRRMGFFAPGELFQSFCWPHFDEKKMLPPKFEKCCDICFLEIVLLYKLFRLSFFVKFGLSEKQTKFEKNLPHGFDKSADLLSKRQNHEEDFFKLCVLLKKSEL